MVILAIESSCDETAIAILEKNKIVRNVISSQIDVHKKFGGVVPEIASRLHTQNFPFVIQEAIQGYDLNKIDAIAYTNAPGLIGCLQVGYLVASAIAQTLDVPLIPVNHLDGHIYAAAIDHKVIYPALALIASGGHTQLVQILNRKTTKIIGETQDDAVGEVYDKVGRKLNLEYPGGPKIDKLSKLGQPKIKFPTMHDKTSLDFSFSGIKSSVINYLHNCEQKKEKVNVADVCASFQNTVVEILINKTKNALLKRKYKTLILAGGVSANSQLRCEFLKLHTNAIIPKMEYCTDNAAMIAMAAKIIQ